jgi:uncharacterized protein with NAD-binding domain and iron-sulfur cluster
MPAQAPKQKIAVLGGGLGSLSTVYGLTSRPGWEEKYDITVYQMGWRLGGKGASGRVKEKGDRIEEHGLHIWMGCYHNAFNMIQTAYRVCREKGLTPGTPFPDWQDAFKEHSLVTLMDDFAGQWQPWSVTFPTNDEVPGTGGLWLEPWDYLQELIRFVIGRIEAAGHVRVRTFIAETRHHTLRDELLGIVQTAESLVAEAVEILPLQSTLAHRALQFMQVIGRDVTQHSSEQHGTIATLMEDLAARLYDAIRDDVDADIVLHRLWMVVNLATATISGIIHDGVLTGGFGVIDKCDFQEWLLCHGATKANAWSTLVRSVYDLVFAYDGGCDDRPDLAAGVALRIMFRVALGYRGSIAWKMQAGMGDTVFTPLYKVLQDRGVKFEFFHRVAAIRLTPDKDLIGEIDLGVQATLTDHAKRTNPHGEYAPLYPVKGLLCWPSRPLYDQLEQGAAIRDGGFDLESAWTDWPNVASKTLRLGTDFDRVVLGISIAALKYVAPELGRANPNWQAMLDHVQTVQTQACQVWMDRDAAQMGWHEPESNIFVSYTWAGADMSHLLPMEEWPPGVDVRNISYYCKQFPDDEHIPPPGPDPAFPKSQADRVNAASKEFLNTQIAPIWPRGVDPNHPESLNWPWVVDPDGATGDARFDYQYWRANVDPTERYVMSNKGATQYRLTSETCGFANLSIAGDWTVNGFNAGCVEAAVTSGLMASRAICGEPRKIVGETDSA